MKVEEFQVYKRRVKSVIGSEGNDDVRRSHLLNNIVSQKLCVPHFPGKTGGDAWKSRIPHKKDEVSSWIRALSRNTFPESTIASCRCERKLFSVFLIISERKPCWWHIIFVVCETCIRHHNCSSMFLNCYMCSLSSRLSVLNTEATWPDGACGNSTDLYSS